MVFSILGFKSLLLKYKLFLMNFLILILDRKEVRDLSEYSCELKV